MTIIFFSVLTLSVLYPLRLYSLSLLTREDISGKDVAGALWRVGLQFFFRSYYIFAGDE